MNPSDWSEFFQKMLAAMLAGIGTWLAVRAYYDKRHAEMMDRHAISQTKAYAAERDFDHLKNNQEQMKVSLRQLDDEISENRADIKEIKGMLMVLFSKTGESFSGIFGYKERKE